MSATGPSPRIPPSAAPVLTIPFAPEETGTSYADRTDTLDPPAAGYGR